MIRSLCRRALVFAIAFAGGVAVLLKGHEVAALRRAERAAFSGVAAEAAGAFAVVEASSAARSPWRVHPTMFDPPAPKSLQVLTVGDDPRRVFQSNPPSAADHLVILSQLQERGHEAVAVALPLAWDAADPIALSALNHRLGSFAPAIVAAPLERGITPKPLPPAFLRASVPLASIEGSARLLPAVNRLAYDKVLLGESGTLAGFSRLESEEPTETAAIPLLARWGDRVVFSFPLLVVMERWNVEAEELSIRPGREIRLGRSGPRIPIDAYGRFPFRPRGEAPPAIEAPAETLIEALVSAGSAPAALSPKHPPLVIRDGRDSSVSPGLVALIAALESSPRLGEAIQFSRPPLWFEGVLLALIALIGATFLHATALTRAFVFALTAAVTGMLVLSLAVELHLRLPLLPLAAALLLGFLLPGVFRNFFLVSQRAKEA